MAQDTGWFSHSIGSNGRTTGNSTSNITINTDGTGAGPTLQIGETFQIGTATYTYSGTATVGGVNGFYATIGTQRTFFSETPASNGVVSFGTDETVICFYPGTLVRTPDIQNGLYDIHWLEGFLKTGGIEEG